MRTEPDDRTGILIVRLWMEPRPDGGLRARITHTLDSAAPDSISASAGDAEGIYALVRTWVEAFTETATI